MRGGVGVVVLAAIAALPGRCWALSSQLAVQFHRVEEFVRLVRPDGTPFDTTLTNDVWTQMFGIRHSQRLGASTTLSSQFDWSDNYYVGQVFRNQTPSGRVSIASSTYAFSANYQQTLARTAFTPASGFLASGVAPATQVSSVGSQRLQVAGFLSLPRLPRIDLSWQRDHRNTYSFSPQQTNISRSVRLSQSLGPMSVRFGYSDAARGVASARVQAPYQSAWDAQAGFGVTPRPEFSFGSQYTFSTVRRNVDTGVLDRNTTHGLSVGGGYRPRKDLSLDLAYAFRHSELGPNRRFVTVGHDGSLGLSYRPLPIASLGLAGALRTDATVGQVNVARSIVGSARVGGRMRHGWDADASASPSWSWDRFRSGITLDNVAGRSQFELRHGLTLTTDGQLSFGSVASATGERTVATASVGVITHPFRAFDLSASQGSYRAGPRLAHATSRSRTQSLDLSWRPVRSVAFQAGLSQAGAQPNNRPRTSTGRYELRWQPSGGMSLATVYTRSNSQQTGAFSSQITGHESLAARLSALLGRSTQLSAGFAVTDPGASSSSRQYDASITKTFGR